MPTPTKPMAPPPPTAAAAEPITSRLAAGSRRVYSAVCEGMETRLMQIECSFTRGFAGLQLLGHSSEVCRDGKERARVALEYLGIQIPPQRLVISLTPADVKMDGNQFDLPVAVALALLLREGQPQIQAERWLFAAELGLDGELRPVRGIISFAIAAIAAGLEGLVIAHENHHEVSVLMALNPNQQPALKARAFATLKEVLDWLDAPAAAARPLPAAAVSGSKGADFDDMILPDELHLVALVASAGMHSLLLRGPPGTGKSMLASRLPSIMPDLEGLQHTEVLRIYSGCMERLPSTLLAGRPPYRAPHHQASAAAVMGSAEAAGELALAHGGVLFLDELPEFRRDLLEALREPLETGEVRLARSRRKVVWKAQVMLVAACNNCPCGWAGSRRRICTCGNGRLLSYRQRLSGPILDRIDLHVNVPELPAGSAELLMQLAMHQPGQTERMLAKVGAARRYAAARNLAWGCLLNRDLSALDLVKACGLEPLAFAALVEQVVPAHASTRSVLRSLRVARTLADLDEVEAVRLADVRQAWRWQAEQAARERGEEVHTQ